MPSNLDSMHVPPSLDEQIEFAQRQVDKQEGTIASLAGDGHETGDASHHLMHLLTTLNTLLKKKITAR